jgi:hypothetical protein
MDSAVNILSHSMKHKTVYESLATLGTHPFHKYVIAPQNQLTFIVFKLQCDSLQENI